MGRNCAIALLACALAFACAAGARAACKVHIGDRVALYGTSDDPDVFIWDSRFRMRDYAGGSFDQMRALLPHATLAPAGTRARVEACVADFIQSKYLSQPDDAVGVVITSGPLRGTRGWVVGDAIRVVWGRRYTTGKTRGPRAVSSRSTAMP